MPNLTAHIDMALDCLEVRRHTVLEENLGSFLLGSCSPDIRIVTRGHRDNTHFAPVSNEVLGAGTSNMFRLYPGLADARKLSSPTLAFMAGYISHLIADEAWIIKIYRPYFGNRDVFADEMMANILDRAVQLDLDRAASEKHNRFEKVTPVLWNAHEGVDVDFIDADALTEFRQRVAEATERGFDWQRLLFMARRQYPKQNGAAEEIASRFLEQLPWSLEHVHQRVPWQVIEEFRRTITRTWVQTMREYLP